MKRPKHLYYITHRNNLKSILKEGILSRNQITGSLWTKLTKKTKSIHSEDVIQIRKEKKFRGQSLWNYANVYFQARNPMLYRVIQKFGIKNIIVLEVDSDIMNSLNSGITDGNAASQDTEFFEDIHEGLETLTAEQFKKQYWNDTDSTKRTIMAEALIHSKIPQDKIIGIYTATPEIARQIRKEFGPLNTIPSSDMFFLSEYYCKLSEQISLHKGDMFFSDKQTFTVSVNTVGIMGKGLASRAKYQFPDVYVLYQDICRQKKLNMGAPYLYKREENFIKILMENSNTNVTENGHRWFLLFPTKNHWKERSPIAGIERGLQWLLDNYKTQGIKSLALPALGCGLGGLDWKEVGPLMCKYLNKMEIRSSIYLPLEKQIPKEQLTSSFLLK